MAAPRYELADVVEREVHGLPVRLRLCFKRFSAIPGHPVLCWRTVYRRSGNNRRFYRTNQEDFWRLPATVAHEMLEEAAERGMLAERFDDPMERWGGGYPSHESSFDLGIESYRQRFSEIVLPGSDANVWGPNAAFLVGTEPKGLWRKVALANLYDDIATFRSLTTDPKYRPVITATSLEPWRMDNAMQDVSVQTARAFLAFFRSVRASGETERREFEAEAEALSEAGEFDASDEADARARVRRSVALRQGQPEFRRRLLQAYGHCVISGCTVAAALEAAHIVPYRGGQTNDVRNGLLLRADLHTLFDQYYWAVEPETRTVRLAEGLRGSSYELFEGRVLGSTVDPNERPHADAVAHRWSEFLRRQT